MAKDNRVYINREISWLSFNERVLQEAADPAVPLLERIKFLGIFSNNLDEFFRVRFATMRRMVEYGIEPGKAVLGGSPADIIKQIQQVASQQRAKFKAAYDEITETLARDHSIHILTEKDLDEEQGRYVKDYFQQRVMPTLTPIMIDGLNKLPQLNDKNIYLAVKLSKADGSKKNKYALIEIMTDVLSRFFVLPEKDGNKYVMLLDDVIRYNLNDIFYIFEQDTFEAYTIKVTRDAELDLDNDVSKSLLELISKSVKKRQEGSPVRFIYDRKIAADLLEYLSHHLSLSEHDNVVSGGRYHNFKDFMGFPDLGEKELLNKKVEALTHPDLKHNSSVLSVMKEKDIMLHFPYQTFHHIIDLLREAAIDPKVQSIKITLYRVAKYSAIANALVNALRNGKQVMVVVELQARFDEESNIFWAKRLFNEGAHVIYGVKSLKVHSKLCLITRKEKNKLVQYANITTANYNEDTAKVYSDDSLLTCDTRITKEVGKVFDFFDNNFKISRYKHLIVSPFTLRKKLSKLIKTEIANAEAGKEAYIILKLNSLVDQEMINKLYDASNAGVKIRMVIRGICSLVPGVKGLSENIEAVSIVDKYLEHSRVYIFCNGGNEKYYISSADWMTRNLDHRTEVACPIYDKDLQQELRDIIEIQLKDNVKARVLEKDMLNEYKRNDEPKVRAQTAIYKYLQEKRPVPELI